MYVVYGVNQTSKSLYEELVKERKDVCLVGDDTLKETNSGLTNVISEKELFKEKNQIEVVFLLNSNISKNLKFLEKLSDRNILVILLKEEDESWKNFEDKGIDIIVDKIDVLTNSLINESDFYENVEESKNLEGIIENTNRKIAIFVHNNPDPDAIASAMALEQICEKWNKQCGIYYSGTIGHPENELFLEFTGLELINLDSKSVEMVLDKSEKIIFVDFAIASVNNILPKGTQADVIIDHHYTNKDIRSDGFVDIRTDVGAASTIMTKHLQNLDIDISSLLASALLYGIKVDTNDYTKNIHTADFKVISYLSSLADPELLEMFESPPLEPNTVNALGRAISNRNIEENILTTYMGNVVEKDDIPQVADLLTREKDIVTVLAYGCLGDNIYMSARCKAIDINIGHKMKRAFSDIGEAGGHSHAAGGKIPISIFKNENEAVKEIERRFKEKVL